MPRLLGAASLLLFARTVLSDGYSRPKELLAPPIRELRVLVPAFGGDDVGVSVATILNLQIWRTLRVPRNEESHYSSAHVLWDDERKPVEVPDAVHSASEANAHIVIWGKAFRYGDGTLVEAFLTFPELSSELQAAQQWTVQLWSRGSRQDFTAGLPSRHYQFAPIIIRNEILANYRTPGDLKIYKQAEGGNATAILGKQDFRALKHEREAVQVRLENGATGWVRLPRLSTARSEIVDFAAGLIRILRHDWPGAQSMLTSVIDNTSTPTAIRLDALLLRALAKESNRGEWQEDVRRARQINPYDADAIRYELMFLLREAERGGEERAGYIRAAQRLARESRLLFDDDDRFISAVLRLDHQ